MILENITADEALAKLQVSCMAVEKNIAVTKEAYEEAVSIAKIFINRTKLDSSNSSKAPSTDNNKKNNNNKQKSNRKAGGQKGHKGNTIEPRPNVDETKNIKINRKKLPKGKTFTHVGYESRQVIEITICEKVVEYRAEILVDENGKKYVAKFPKGVTRPVQYGNSVKASTTYLSQYQLLPYDRIAQQYKDEYNMPLSSGSIYNFNQEAAKLLLELEIEKKIKQALKNSGRIHADETGINIKGEKKWLHTVADDYWTWYEHHDKRGVEAMKAINILPSYNGVLCHDHWKPYYTYNCIHSLCNSHHLRELKRAYEQDDQSWAKKMYDFLLRVRNEVADNKRKKLPKKICKLRRKEYKNILAKGEIECPLKLPKKGTRMPAQSKSRNLLSRLIKFENDVLRFMENSIVPFSNNLAERDLRMTKVQQKISGCFRSQDGAKGFCIVRSYLSTCQKHGVTASKALELLFDKKLPDFFNKILDSS